MDPSPAPAGTDPPEPEALWPPGSDLLLPDTPEVGPSLPGSQPPDPPASESCFGDAALALTSPGPGAVADSATLADVTGDGQLDLVLGARYNPNTNASGGWVKVTSSAERGTVVLQPDDWRSVLQAGWSGNSTVGCCVEAGEVNGTTHLLVGAPTFTRSPTPGDPGGVGRARRAPGLPGPCPGRRRRERRLAPLVQ